MLQIRLSIVLGVLTCLLQAQGASKYYTDDENRPYEFGFNIEGEQHRHEKKDENGLIEGEFGFITADNVYHVTVYATDENGNFKILSMKNIRLNRVQERKSKELPLTPPAQNEIPQPGPTQPARTCSSCSIPSPVQPQQPAYTPQESTQYDPQENPQYNPQENPQYDPQQNPQYDTQQNPQYDTQQNPQYDSQQNPQYDSQQNPQYDPNYDPNYQQNYPQDYPQYPEQSLQPGDRNPKQFNDFPPQYGNNPEKPTLVSAQMQIVDPNTDIYRRGPGEREGLPPGLTKDDMTTLLYTFNYTVGFHGHHEEGFTNGAKKGYYYVTGRDGTRTRIDYEADENGFRPKITTEVLDLISEEVPKEETEKDEKYGLKGYEFKWLYYPVGSKKR